VVSVGSRLLWLWQLLMIAERTNVGLISSEIKEMIEEMDGDLTKVIEDFMRAVDVEALYSAKMSGKHRASVSIGQYSVS